MRDFRRVTAVFGLVYLGVVFGAAGRAQSPGAPPNTQASDSLAEPPEEGMPIRDTTVLVACRPCHSADPKDQLSRISFRRDTPEGWENTIRRMVSLNDAKIEPADARTVVRYLANHLGLAPEEARAAAFESERRLDDFKYTPSKDTEAVCTKCHSIGRVMLQRRTKEEWHLLVNMHRGWYPLSDFQAFRRMGPPEREPGPDGRPPDNRHPVEKALDHLTAAFPLQTPEWAAWSATMRPPKLEGTWVILGHETSKGPMYGRMTIAPGGMPDEFTTDITLVNARSGQTIHRKGRAIVYTGFQWRGRSTEGENPDTSLREVMFVDRDWQSMEGRWFMGGYDELGIDVKLRRLGGEPALLGTSRSAVRIGTSGQEVRLFGANLPASLTPKDIDVGAGVTVSRVSDATPDSVVLTVDVAASAPAGPRDIVLGGTVRPGALAVFDRVDYISVTPEWAMARVGGVTFPKMLARFEAIGFQNGRDGKKNTKDDVNLGMVDAKWTLEEYAAILNDEDLKYVGSIDANTGVFTPNVEGPNTSRPGNANNIGDVWVVATYTPEGAAKPARLRARAHLLVTVPLYMRWGSWEATQ